MTDEKEIFSLPCLGEVWHEDRIMYFDGPILFTVRNERGERYLGYWADAEDPYWTYLYAPISEERYISLLQGGIEVRDAFTEPAEILVLLWNTTTDEYEKSLWKTAQELDDEQLPQRGFRIPGCNGQLRCN